MIIRPPRDAGCVGLCSADMLARIRQTSFRRLSPSKGNEGRVPLRVHDGGFRGLGGMLVEAGQRDETRVSGQVQVAIEMDGWLEVKGAQSRVRQGKVTARWLGWGWTGNGMGGGRAGSRAGATCHSAARLISFPGLLLALDW